MWWSPWFLFLWVWYPVCFLFVQFCWLNDYSSFGKYTIEVPPGHPVVPWRASSSETAHTGSSLCSVPWFPRLRNPTEHRPCTQHKIQTQLPNTPVSTPPFQHSITHLLRRESVFYRMPRTPVDRSGCLWLLDMETQHSVFSAPAQVEPQNQNTSAWNQSSSQLNASIRIQDLLNHQATQSAAIEISKRQGSGGLDSEFVVSNNELCNGWGEIKVQYMTTVVTTEEWQFHR